MKRRKNREGEGKIQAFRSSSLARVMNLLAAKARRLYTISYFTTIYKIKAEPWLELRPKRTFFPGSSKMTL